MEPAKEMMQRIPSLAAPLNGAIEGARPPGWTQDQKELIKRTVCPSNLTDDELKLFLHIAAKSGLDPLQKQIHCIRMGGRLSIIAGIDGLQARAAREADFEGIIHGVVCEKDTFVYNAAAGGISEHAYNAFGDRGKILGAWATVRRKGMLPFTALAKFSEFSTGQQNWQKMPTVMIDKVARSTALRMAYPEQFSSIYEAAELDQAEPETEEAHKSTKPAAAPPPNAMEAAKADLDEKKKEASAASIRAKAKALWGRCAKRGLDSEQFRKWCAEILQSDAPSAKWTEKEVALLEAHEKALDAARAPGEEG